MDVDVDLLQWYTEVLTKKLEILYTQEPGQVQEPQIKKNWPLSYRDALLPNLKDVKYNHLFKITFVDLADMQL